MYKCDICKSNLIWQSDFDFEDYMIEDNEGIVTVYLCPECETMYEIFIDANNNIIEVLTSDLAEE